MKAHIRQLLNERLSVPVREVISIRRYAKRQLRCHCNDYVSCKTCRNRLWSFNKRRKAAGMKPLPMPPPKPRPLVCECGECNKCIHRFKVREWRRMEAQK